MSITLIITYPMCSALKLMIVGIKLSFITILLMAFQVRSRSPRSVQIDSSASFTMSGGLAKARISTRCCFFMLLTAIVGKAKVHVMLVCATYFIWVSETQHIPNSFIYLFILYIILSRKDKQKRQLKRINIW